MKTSLAVAAVMGMASWLFATDYYVAQQDPRAGDANPGTEALPFKTITNACAAAQAGDTVYIKTGTYREPLMPKHSGAKGKPITFQAYKKDFVMIKGSEVLTGLERVAGTNLWVKRPWTKELQPWPTSLSVAPYKDSARMDQVFVNEEPLQWVPSRAELQPGCFVWDGKPQGGELVIRPPAGVTDPAQALVEIPVIHNVVGAWQGDPGGIAEVRALRRDQPDHPAARKQYPEIHYIHIRGLHFRHARHNLNRVGVRLDGDYWVLENCTVEYMNCVGVSAAGNNDVVRNCVVSHNGQSALDCGEGPGHRFENVVTLYNNYKLFSTGFGGAGNKLCFADHVTVKGLVAAFNYGYGLWFDIDCHDVTVEDCLSFGNRGGYFYEVSWDAVIRRNIAFNGVGPTVLISCSSSNRVEDNVLIGAAGGIHVGGIRERRGHYATRYPDRPWYKAEGNLVRHNIVVEPQDYTIEAGLDTDFDASSPQANNRFQDNVFLVQRGNPQVRFGPDGFDNPRVFDAKIGLAEGNRYFTDLAKVDRRTRKELNRAFKAILNSLVLADPKFALNLDRVEVKEIWSLESETPLIGYWLRGDGRNFLVLDLTTPGTFQLISPGATNAALCDFPVVKRPTVTPLTPNGRILTGEAEGPFALVTGLSDATRPMSGVFRVAAEAQGAPVRTLPFGQPFEVVVHLHNPFPAGADFAVSGSGIDGQREFHLEREADATLRVPLTASPGTERLAYELASKLAPSYSRKLYLKVLDPGYAPTLSDVALRPEDERENPVYGPGLTVDRELQRITEIYDKRTGVAWQGPKDLSGRIHVGWNAQGLFVHARVTDNIVSPNLKVPYEGDCVEVFLDGRVKDRGAKTYAPGVVQLFLMPPDANQKGWQPLRWASYQTNKGVVGRGRILPDGYLLEARISWALFPELKPATGTVLGCDVALDDSDVTPPERITQMYWRGTGDDFRDASRFGMIVLDKPVEENFGEALRPGDVVARNSGSELTIFRDRHDPQPWKKVALHVEGRSAGTFSGGACFDPDGNFYFADGFHNMRIQMLPAGASRARVVLEFPPPEANPHMYITDLLASARDRLLVQFSDGTLAECAVKEQRVLRKSPVLGGGHGGDMALSPDGKFVVSVPDEPDGRESICMVRAEDWKVMSRLGDNSALVARPGHVIFVPAAKPFLAVAQGNAVPADGKTNACRRVTRLDYDPQTGQLAAPPAANLPDGKSFSFVAHTGVNEYFSSLDAIVLDARQNKVLLSSRTRTRGPPSTPWIWTGSSPADSSSKICSRFSTRRALPGISRLHLSSDCRRRTNDDYLQPRQNDRLCSGCARVRVRPLGRGLLRSATESRDL